MRRFSRTPRRRRWGEEEDDDGPSSPQQEDEEDGWSWAEAVRLATNVVLFVLLLVLVAMVVGGMVFSEGVRGWVVRGLW